MQLSVLKVFKMFAMILIRLPTTARSDYLKKVVTH